MKSFVLFAFIAAGLACGADTPVPDYPVPEALPLEETDLAEFVGGGEDYEEEEDEEWDDGLDDADLEMNPPDETAPAAEAAPAEE